MLMSQQNHANSVVKKM